MRHALSSIAHNIGHKINTFLDRMTAELAENRTLLVWLYSLAFLALVFYTAVVNPLSHNTSIMTMGGIISVCFSSWVCAGAYEKVCKMRMPMSVDVDESEKGASD
jgi:lipopolysaccharide export LptBFGC system permease protein LptF